MGHKSDLSAAVDGIQSRYCVQGSYRPSQDIEIRVNGQTHKLPMSMDQASKSLAPMVAAARDSAFGKGKKTVMDKTVRVAKELLPEEFSINFDPAPLLEKVRLTLVPDSPAITAQLHKLNIMTQGGFFKEHKDTPRGAKTCFGTLVVCLPVPFSGGFLELKHNGERALINWGQALSRGSWCPTTMRSVPIPDAALHWVAFFGDVMHAVDKVHSGMRLTLTYVLHRQPPADPTADALLVRASVLHGKLLAALGDKAFMKEGGSLGFHCRHLYEESELAQAEGVLAAGGRGAYAAQLALKNEDAVVAAVLAAAGLQVTALRILKMTEHDWDEDLVLDKMPTASDKKKFCHKEYIECSFKDWAVTPEDVFGYAKGSVSEVAGAGLVWIGSNKACKTSWLSAWLGENFGNESAMTEFYTAAALVAKVPPYKERAKALKKAAPQHITAAHVGPASAAAAAGGTAADAGPSRKRSTRSRDQGSAGSASTSSSKASKAAPLTAPPVLQYPEPAAVDPKKQKGEEEPSSEEEPESTDDDSSGPGRSYDSEFDSDEYEGSDDDVRGRRGYYRRGDPWSYSWPPWC